MNPLNGMRISMREKTNELRAIITKFTDLAEIVGLSRPYLVKIENLQWAISLEEGNAISMALGISL